MQNDARQPRQGVSLNVFVIIHHFIFISSVSTVYKNTHNLRCSNQLFQNCPVLILDLALDNLARELHCSVPLLRGRGEVLAIGAVFNTYYFVELDTTEFSNQGVIALML